MIDLVMFPASASRQRTSHGRGRVSTIVLASPDFQRHFLWMAFRTRFDEVPILDHDASLRMLVTDAGAGRFCSKDLQIGCCVTCHCYLRAFPMENGRRVQLAK